jgi:hypothetical protein
MRCSNRSLTTVMTVIMAMLLAWACGASTPNPVVTHVLPSSAEPGAFLLLRGRDLPSSGDVLIGDRAVERVTWVSADLATALLPKDLAPGTYPLRVRFPSGRDSLLSLTIRNPAPPPAPPVTVVLPAPLPTIQLPPITVQPIPPVLRRDVEEPKNRDHPGKGRGRQGGR